MIVCCIVVSISKFTNKRNIHYLFEYAYKKIIQGSGFEMKETQTNMNRVEGINYLKAERRMKNSSKT